MHPFEKALSEKVLVSDGAKGTMLQALGLAPGACPDEWNISNTQAVIGIHREYALAGAEVLATNTFNSLPLKLARHSLAGKCNEIVMAGVAAAKNAASAIPGRKFFIAGSVPPSGQFVKPVGNLEFDAAVSEYRILGKALHDAGVDVFWLETFTDILEIKAAMVGIREVSGLPIVAMMTFEESGKTLLGTPPQVAALCLEKLGACAVGANCSLGPSGILDCLRMMREATGLPFVSQPNAGVPVLKNGKTVFPETPEGMAGFVQELINTGARVIGGCCGTGPAHVKANAAAVKNARIPGLGEMKPVGGLKMRLSSRSRIAVCGKGELPLLVGERINPSGRPKFGKELLSGSMETVEQEARNQRDSGAMVLDVNVGVAGGDETVLMREAVRAAQSAADLPVSIDSSSIPAIESGLKAAAGRPLINSVNGEEKRIESILPLAKKYGAAVIALCLDEKGIPKDAGERLKIADRIRKKALAAGLSDEDIIYDFLTLAVASAPDQVVETLKAVSAASDSGRLTLLGASNISFGLPSRSAVNSSFTAMAAASGLDAVIINTCVPENIKSLAAASLLSGRDKYSRHYLSLFRTAVEQGAESGVSKKADIYSRLSSAVTDGAGASIVSLVEEALSMKIKPMDISSKALMPAMSEVGRLFRQNEIYLPQVMMSASAMQTALNRIEKELGESAQKDSPLVLLATVEGDIHDLGKGIVAALLRNSGYRVIDAGTGIPAGKIVELAAKMKPSCIGLSALMTTTMVRMKEVIAALHSAGIETPVMVGGAVLTADYAKSIGAHYGSDAVDAVELARKLI